MIPDLDHVVWRKSRRSGGTNGNCVEVTFGIGAGAVRDSKNPGRTIAVDLEKLLAAVKADAFHA